MHENVRAEVLAKRFPQFIMKYDMTLQKKWNIAEYITVFLIYLYKQNCLRSKGNKTILHIFHINNKTTSILPLFTTELPYFIFYIRYNTTLSTFYIHLLYPLHHYLFYLIYALKRCL